MRPKYHFIFGIFLVIIISLLFPDFSLFELSIIFISSFFIDVDHLFYDFFKKGNLNLIKSYNEHSAGLNNLLRASRKKRKQNYLGLYIFHGIEWFVILFLFGLCFSPLFFLILIGVSFHFLTDFIYERLLGCSFDKTSLIYNLYRLRKFKNKN